jgi:hypothetical protein
MAVTACSSKDKELTDKLPKEAAAILDRAPEIELYSLDPTVDDSEFGNGGLRGWKVLGKTVVKKGEMHTNLLAALNKSIGEGGNKCFWPRHAIRAVHEGKIVELLICFQCEWVYVYLSGKDEKDAVALRDGSAEAVFDRVLKDAGVPLAPKGKGR